MSTNTKTARKEFTVRFNIASNDETGEEFVLDTDKQIGEAIAVARADFEQKMDEWALLAKDESAITKARAAFEVQQTALCNRLTRERNAALPGAQEHVFTLVKPDHGQFLQIRAEANVPNEITGIPSFDYAAYSDKLLKNDGVKQDGRTLSAIDIDGLDSTVSQVLGARLAGSVEPDPKRVVFTGRVSRQDQAGAGG